MRARECQPQRVPLWVWWVLALALGALLLMPGAARAQSGIGGVFGGSSPPTSSTPDPARADTAASYTATGAGVRTVPAATPGALGACAALAGLHSAATPTGELAPSPYFCNGVAWRRVWTDADGVVANADTIVPVYTAVSNAPDGAIAFQANNKGRWKIGPGVNSEIVDLGTAIGMSSVVISSGQSLRADTIANTTAAASINVSTARYLRLIQSSLPTCGTNDSGGLVSASSDGNRLYQCDGTAVYRVSRVAGPGAVTVDVADIAASDCVITSVTVTGAALNDTIWANADFALPTHVFIANVRTTAANTVALKLCNLSTTTAENPDSGSFRFRIER